MSFLPSIKSIDRYGKSLDANAKESIIQIYNNLKSNVTVSEVYVVLADMNLNELTQPQILKQKVDEFLKTVRAA
jgi:hypothetical protein